MFSSDPLVYNEDALDFLQSMDWNDGAYHADGRWVITDPPYGESGKYLYEGEFKDPPLTDEYIENFAKVCRKIAEGAFVFCGINEIGRWFEAYKSAGFKHVRQGVWIKPNAWWQPAPYAAGCLEGFICATKTKREECDSVIPAYVCSYSGHLKEGEQQHPFRKPIPLLRQVIRDLKLSNAFIIDPFAGTGSVGVAAKLEGNATVSNDRDPKCLKNLVWRLQNHYLWESSKPKEGIMATGSGKPRKRKPFSFKHEERKTIAVIMASHTLKAANGNPMTEREFLQTLLGKHYDQMPKKGEKKAVGLIGRNVSQANLWKECARIKKLSKKTGKELSYPRMTDAERRDQDILDILANLQSAPKLEELNRSAPTAKPQSQKDREQQKLLPNDEGS